MSLQLSIKCARVHQTRLLLDIETNPNIPDTDSKTPLMLACLVAKQYVGERIVRMLLDKEAIVSSKDKHDRTALSYASMSGKEKIVKILLEDIEYDINAQDDEGNTPLMYTAMSGNATALRYVLEVLMKYRLSVDLRNTKGFSAYLLAAKMGHFYCAHILKTEGYASDGIRDTEYFLSDKEWIEKVRKEIAKMQVKEKETRLVSYRSTPGRDSTMARPHTSVDFQRIQSNFNGPTESSYFLRPRAGTRLTTRSEPPVRLHKYNSWINTEERAARTGRTSASSVSERSFVISVNSTEATEIVPSEVRTKPPDLHAILSHYLNQEVYRPVKVTPRNNIKNVRFVEREGSDTLKASNPPKQRKPGRLMRQNSRRNLLSV